MTLRAVSTALADLAMDEDLRALKDYLALRMDGIERVLNVRVDSILEAQTKDTTFFSGQVAEVTTRHRQLNDGIILFERELLKRVEALERQQANLAGRLWMLGAVLAAVIVIVNVVLKILELARVVP